MSLPPLGRRTAVRAFALALGNVRARQLLRVTHLKDTRGRRLQRRGTL